MLVVFQFHFLWASLKRQVLEKFQQAQQSGPQQPSFRGDSAYGMAHQVLPWGVAGMVFQTFFLCSWLNPHTQNVWMGRADYSSTMTYLPTPHAQNKP